jgi:hypothetical protein
MSNKAVKASKPKKRQQKAAQKPLRQSRMRLLLRAAISGLIALVGVVAAVVTLLPRVTVTVSNPTVASDPFSSSVTIANTGYIPLNSVKLGFSPIDISRGSFGIHGESDGSTVLWYRPWGDHDLGLDDKFTVGLNDLLYTSSDSRPFSKVSVILIVDYEIPIIHWRREKRFPMTAKSQRDGSVLWFANEKPN